MINWDLAVSLKKLVCVNEELPQSLTRQLPLRKEPLLDTPCFRQIVRFYKVLRTLRLHVRDRLAEPSSAEEGGTAQAVTGGVFPHSVKLTNR